MNILIKKGVRPGETADGVRTTLIVNVIIFTLLVVVQPAGRFDSLSTNGVAAFVLAGLLATFLGRYTLFAAIRRLGAARAAAIKNATPLISVGLAVGLLGEVLSILAVLGIASVVLGLLLLVREVHLRTSGVSQF